MAAAVDERRDAHSLAHEERSHALGAIELVRGQRQQVDVHLADVHRHVADGLHRVRVEDDLSLAADGADLPDGLNSPDLVVRVHDRDEDRPVRDGGPDIVGIDEAGAVHRNGSHFQPMPLQELGRVENRVVLDGGGDDVAALLLEGDADADEGLIVGLGATAGEDDLLRIGPEQVCDVAAGRLHPLGRLPAGGVQARRIAPLLLVVGQHGLNDLGPRGRGRGVVEVDSFHVKPPGRMRHSEC